MNQNRIVAVLGASGFIGRTVVEALALRDAQVVPIRTPRFVPVAGRAVRQALTENEATVADLAAQFSGCDAVVLAAGLSAASEADERVLMAPNALVPAVVASAVRVSGLRRMVHVSSAAVQGRRSVLDESIETQPFSPYSRSKALGEELVREIAGAAAVLYRPPGVHGPDRATTRSLAKIAASPIASVARPASSPTPQALVQNVADAIAFLATCEASPPSVVMHPSEGLTTGSVLTLLGGRSPREVPHGVATGIVRLLAAGGRAVPPLAATARRVEMLWLGQGQASSWLTRQGWTPPVGREGWEALGRQMATDCRRLDSSGTEKVRK